MENQLQIGTPADSEAEARARRTVEENKFGGPKQSRVTVVEQVTFETPTRGQQQWSLPQSRWIDGDEQPLERQATATLAWQHLETGWVKRCCLLRIVNRSELPLEVCLRGDGEPDLVVEPFDSARLCPADLGQVQVRGDGRYDVVVLPGGSA